MTLRGGGAAARKKSSVSRRPSAVLFNITEFDEERPVVRTPKEAIVVFTKRATLMHKALQTPAKEFRGNFINWLTLIDLLFINSGQLSDVILASFPGSGVELLQHIIHLLREGSTDYDQVADLLIKY